MADIDERRKTELSKLDFELLDRALTFYSQKLFSTSDERVRCNELRACFADAHRVAIEYD